MGRKFGGAQAPQPAPPPAPAPASRGGPQGGGMFAQVQSNLAQIQSAVDRNNAAITALGEQVQQSAPSGGGLGGGGAKKTKGGGTPTASNTNVFEGLQQQAEEEEAAATDTGGFKPASASTFTGDLGNFSFDIGSTNLGK